MKFQFKAALVGAFTAAAALSANATIVTVFDAVGAGVTSFNNTVTAAGATPKADNLNVSSGTSIVRPDYTITAPDGSFMNVGGYGTLSGDVISIDPQGPNGLPRANPNDYKDSGVKFTFNSPINAIGFEVGDWGTCCQPSALYISFGNGAPIQVGLSTTGNEGFFNGRFEIFVAAFDDTGDFSEVTFWGDGIGEILVAGGTIRYALLDQGSLPGVPEPGTAALAGLAILAAAGASRRRRSIKA